MKRDTAASLEKARAQLAASEAKILELERSRAGMLVDGDLNAITAADRELSDERALVEAIRAKIAALKVELQGEREAALLVERDAFIDGVEKKLAARRKKLAEAINAIVEAATAYAEAKDRRPLVKDWRHDLVPPPSDYEAQHSFIDVRLSRLFARRTGDPSAAPRLMAGAMDQVARNDAALISRLRTSRKPTAPIDDEEQVA